MPSSTWLDSCPSGALVIDSPGLGIRFANAAFCRLTGYDREELRRLAVSDLHPPDAPWSIPNDRTWMDRVAVVRRDRRTVAVELTTSPLDLDGHPGLIGWFRDLTDRDHAEAIRSQHLELQDQFDRVAASVPGMICSFRLRPDGTACMPFATPVIEDIYGLRPEDVRDDFSPILERIHPEDREPLLRDIRESARTMTPWRGAFRARNPSRGDIRVEGYSVPRQEPDGSIVWHGFVQEVTERHRAEAALRTSEERFHAYVEQATDALFVHDLAGRFLEVNHRACTTLGYRREELLGMSIFEVDRALDRGVARSQLAGLTPGDSLVLLRRHHRKDGSTFPVEIHLGSFLVRGNRQFLAMVRDITDRQQAEEALRRSETRYRIVAENTFDWEFWLGPDGRYVYTSPSCERITGHRREAFEADATLLERLVHPEDLELYLAHRHAALEGHEDEELEFRIVRPDGAVRWIGHVCSPVRDEMGVFLGVRGSNRDITERKQANAALRESSTRFRALIENAPDGVVLCRPDGVLTYASPTACRIFGYDPTDVRDINPNDGTHPEDLPAVLAALEELLRQPAASRTLAYRFRTKSGGWRWIESTFTNMVGVPGVDAIVINFRDIDDRKRAEDALKEREAMLREMGRVAKVGGWEFEVATGEGRWTEEVARIHGLEPEVRTNQAIGLSFYQGESRARIQAAVERAIRDGEPYELELELVAADGTRKWVYTIGQPVKEGGRVVKLRGAFQDITRYKRAEDALAMEATRRRILIEGSRDGIVILDENGKVVEANRRFAEMLGYTADEVLQLHVWDWDRDWPRERVMEAIRSLGPEGAHLESRHWRKDGTRLNIELSNSTAVLGGTKLVFCVCHDVTERRRLEMQLRQAQKLEAIGQLAGGVAHDFNNIVAAILLHLDLIQNTASLDPEISQGLKDMETEARRAATLTRQLLMFSRRSVLDTKPLDLNEVTKDLLKMLGRLIREDIKLTFECYTGRLPAVSADAGMVEQVLVNLVVNARDAMPRGGRITIGTDLATLTDADQPPNPDRRPGRFVRLSVADTGNGMPKEVLERLFEPFFTTKPPGKGTGLGLATVHGIVAQHRGWVEVESEVDHGTTFRVYLPALDRTARQVLPEETHEPMPRGRETVLLVEDERPLRRTIALSLRVLGYRVLEAANGPEAWQLWREQAGNIDLLFSDMVMPEGMTGLELAERMRATKPSLKVIVSSGYSSEICQAGGITRAGITYLAKPYQTRTLAETVRGCLDRE